MKKRIALFLMLLNPLNKGHGMQPQKDTQHQIPALFMLTEDLLGYLGDFLETQEYTKIAQSNRKSYAISISINPRHDYSKEMIRYVATDEKLREIVSTYPKLSVLNLKGFRMIEDAGLEHLKSLDNLTSLNLGHCNKITDQGLKHLAHLLRLTSLNLAGVPLLRTCWLKPIRTLTNLTSLNLADCGLDSLALLYLEPLINLTSLNLSGMGSHAYGGIDTLNPLTKLTSLNLANTVLTRNFQSSDVLFLTNLTSLNLENNSINLGQKEPNAQSLGLLTNLTYLNLRNVYYGSEDEYNQIPISENAEFLKCLINLTSLDLSNWGLTERLEGQLSSLTNLTCLKLDLRVYDFEELKYLKFLACPTSLKLEIETSFGDVEKVDCLTFLTNLISLDVSCYNLSERVELRHLNALTNLTFLNLKYCDAMQNEALESLSILTNLTSLSLELFPKKTNEGVEKLIALSNVCSLSLSCNDIMTDGRLDYLKSLTNITSLSLRESSDLKPVLNGTAMGFCGSNLNITDEGILHLTALPNLISLDINQSGITDKGLENMRLLTNLTSLKVNCSREITAEGVMHLTVLTNLTELDHNNNYGRPGKESRYIVYTLYPQIFENGYQYYKYKDEESSKERNRQYYQNKSKVAEDNLEDRRLYMVIADHLKIKNKKLFDEDNRPK